VGRKYWYPLGLLGIVLLAACSPAQSTQTPPPQSFTGDSIHIVQQPTATPRLTIPRQVSTPKPTPPPPTNTDPGVTPPPPIPVTGPGAAPYGQPPPLTAEEIQLTQQLFGLINSDRAARGLYPFAWRNVLAGGARLHSWNMYHCGFSHTCPDGRTQCLRIADEGFAGNTDCGECIGYAGPYPTAWDGVYTIQESMINEPPDGWHRIHLTSTTLHKVGVGIYVDPGGYIWFTEDLVS
jgi:uncharacterized protein YkwD